MGRSPYPDTDWQDLVSLLDPAVAEAPSDQHFWEQVEPRIIKWLANTCHSRPWLNHLALGLVAEMSYGIAHPGQGLLALDRFLVWAIPDRFSSLASLCPETALVECFGNPPLSQGLQAYQSYSALNLQVHCYLATLSASKQKELERFLLPDIPHSGRLKRLARQCIRRSKERRKVQSFALVHELLRLTKMARMRMRWMIDLDELVQGAVESVQRGELAFPVTITIKTIDGQSDAVFRVWNHQSWVLSHERYHPKWASKLARREDSSGSPVFLQLVGEPPSRSWFLRAVSVGALQGPRSASAECRQYCKDHGLLPSCFDVGNFGLLSVLETGSLLRSARQYAAGTWDDSKVLFDHLPLLAAASVGYFVFITIVSTAMRIGEIQQVTLDRTCTEVVSIPMYDDQTQSWVDERKRVCWKVFPKGATERERYLVTGPMMEAMSVYLDIHDQSCGQIQDTESGVHWAFSHCRRFHSGKHRFLLQWSGRHLPNRVINRCLDFLLLEHGCRDIKGNPVRITPHVLRHAVAGHLHTQGVSLFEIRNMLKQKNIDVTRYYAQLSPEDLCKELAPAITALAQVAETKVEVRTFDDFKRLLEEGLKVFGALRDTRGGYCTTFEACSAQFKCATCRHYVPDPTRRDEVIRKIAAHEKAVDIFEDLGDYLQAESEEAHINDWERVLEEMDEMERYGLVSKSYTDMLLELGAEEVALLPDGLERDLDG